MKLVSGDAAGAEPDLARAVELKPLLAEAHLNRAMALTGLGRLDSAEEALVRARTIDPSSPVEVCFQRLVELRRAAHDRAAASETGVPLVCLETALPVCLDTLVRENKFKVPAVIDLLTRKAANVLRLPAGTLAPGAAADICLFDPAEKWAYDAKAGFSKSSNSPWTGQTLTGRVKLTIVDGRVVFENGKIV